MKAKGTDAGGRSTPRMWAGAGVVAAGMAGFGIGGHAAQAQVAGVGMLVTPIFPSSVSVGQTGVPAQLFIKNLSTGVGPLTMTTLTLNPNCGDPAPTCADPDPGVLAITAPATGATGSACSGTAFSLSAPDANGRYTLTPSTAVVLQTGGTVAISCTIDFSFSVLKLPTKDADPSPGLQTRQFATVAGSAQTLGTPSSTLFGGGTGTSITTVAAAAIQTPAPTPTPSPTPTGIATPGPTPTPTPSPSPRGIAGPPNTGGSATGRPGGTPSGITGWLAASLGLAVLLGVQARRSRRRARRLEPQTSGTQVN